MSKDYCTAKLVTHGEQTWWSIVLDRIDGGQEQLAAAMSHSDALKITALLNDNLPLGADVVGTALMICQEMFSNDHYKAFRESHSDGIGGFRDSMHMLADKVERVTAHFDWDEFPVAFDLEYIPALISELIPKCTESRGFSDLSAEEVSTAAKKVYGMLSSGRVHQPETEDQYLCIALSTKHVERAVMEQLDEHRSDMILKRDTGFFIKLFEEFDSVVELFKGYPNSFLDMLDLLHQRDFRMIEIDCDAMVNPCLATYSWGEKCLA
jgi:hypothetical protein